MESIYPHRSCWRYVAPSPSAAAVLIGDAYHTVTPNLAQGAAVAIEDATNLAAAISTWCHTRDWCSVDVGAALESHTEQVTLRGARHAQMTNFTRNQIMVQSNTAMLAQANQTPNAVLTLLQGRA